MTLTIHIPAFVLWALGVGVGVLLLGMAFYGVLAWFSMREFDRSMSRWFGW